MVVLNSVAQRIVRRRKGLHPSHVFTVRQRVRADLLTPAWAQARKAIGLPHLRIHDMRHTFGRRLQAAGVSFEDRADLLGHTSGRVTTEYSRAEIEALRAAAEKVATRPADKTPTLMVVGGGTVR
jgi:integrase